MGCTSAKGLGLEDGATEEASLGPDDLDELTRADQYDYSSFHKHFVLGGIVGAGCFAQVRLAQHVKSGARVAVKVADLRAGGRQQDGQVQVCEKKKRMATGEASALRCLGASKHCVRFYAEFSDEFVSYIVMEYCPRTLHEALSSLQDVTESTYVGLFRGMLSALKYAHANGIVHRDIKPDNFLCKGNLEVKLCDFGLAVVCASQGASLKGTVGTAPFMSPEMLLREGYGMETDVWSFGVLAYCLLLGGFPYEPATRDVVAMKEAIMNGVPAPTFEQSHGGGAAGSKLSSQALALLSALLVRDPRARVSAAEALQLQWFSHRHPPPQGPEPSLRPELRMARKSGTFEVRTSLRSSTSLEKLLQAAQAKENPSRAALAKERAQTCVPSGESAGKPDPRCLAKTESTTGDQDSPASRSSSEGSSPGPLN